MITGVNTIMMVHVMAGVDTGVGTGAMVDLMADTGAGTGVMVDLMADTGVMVDLMVVVDTGVMVGVDTGVMVDLMVGVGTGLLKRFSMTIFVCISQLHQ